MHLPLQRAATDDSVVLNALQRPRRQRPAAWPTSSGRRDPSATLDDRAGWAEANPAGRGRHDRRRPHASLEADYDKNVKDGRPELRDRAPLPLGDDRAAAHRVRRRLGPDPRSPRATRCARSWASPQDPAGRRASAVVAWKAGDVVNVHVLADVDGYPVDLERFADEVQQAARRLGVRGVAFDPWTDRDLARFFKEPDARRGRGRTRPPAMRFARVVEAGAAALRGPRPRAGRRHGLHRAARDAPRLGRRPRQRRAGHDRLLRRHPRRLARHEPGGPPARRCTDMGLLDTRPHRPRRPRPRPPSRRPAPRRPSRSTSPGSSAARLARQPVAPARRCARPSACPPSSAPSRSSPTPPARSRSTAFRNGVRHGRPSAPRRAPQPAHDAARLLPRHGLLTSPPAARPGGGSPCATPTAWRMSLVPVPPWEVKVEEDRATCATPSSAGATGVMPNADMRQLTLMPDPDRPAPRRRARCSPAARPSASPSRPGVGRQLLRRGRLPAAST